MRAVIGNRDILLAPDGLVALELQSGANLYNAYSPHFRCFYACDFKNLSSNRDVMSPATQVRIELRHCPGDQAQFSGKTLPVAIKEPQVIQIREHLHQPDLSIIRQLVHQRSKYGH